MWPYAGVDFIPPSEIYEFGYTIASQVQGTYKVISMGALAFVREAQV
jgi:hypothetical protein